ncbi:GFA family protein [Pleionea sp. CnH1-48]|uniref:GFA family protein n=1 Tax=Pleionea sp. CnH1-48 TaxID=2954494 RepID=UPI002097C4D0|nr:GFA family protein [Pleionea sp. CnH1-48]MCO7226722.1 GFA family protein [Pleionea sp. CnH1-48]
MLGKCLCEAVQFEIIQPLPAMYQCHCSLCRRVTSSACNSSLIIPIEQLRWISGENNIQSFIKNSGYRVDFCKTCGSPTANEMRDQKHAWIPVGALENSDELEMGAHLFMDSKAQWDQVGDSGKKYSDMPEIKELIHQLYATQ